MAIHRFVLHNGRIRESGEGMLTPGQLGLLAGWGIFSTLRVKDGVLFAWERHWARLSRDSRLMNVPLPPDGDAVRADLTRLIEANCAYNATLRVVFIRNTGGMWEGPHAGGAGDTVAMTANSNQWGDSVRLVYQPEARHSQSDFTRAKINSWAENLRWYERAHENGFDECVLLNERFEVTECTSANIFVVQGNEVWTAPIDSGCLPGITRELLLKEIRVDGIQVGERNIRPAELESADEVFITSTTRDLLPVAQIGNKRLEGSPGVRTELREAFQRYMNEYVTLHKCLTQPTLE